MCNYFFLKLLKWDLVRDRRVRSLIPHKQKNRANQLNLRFPVASLRKPFPKNDKESRFDQKYDQKGQENNVSVDYCKIAIYCFSYRASWSFMLGNLQRLSWLDGGHHESQIPSISPVTTQMNSSRCTARNGLFRVRLSVGSQITEVNEYITSHKQPPFQTMLRDRWCPGVCYLETR